MPVGDPLHRDETPMARYEEIFTTKRTAAGSRRHIVGATITVTKKDEEGILHPHDDALVVIVQVTNFMARRVLIDNGSSADIQLWEVFVRMRINLDCMHPALMSLKGFMGDVVQPVGAITLSVLVGKAPKTFATLIDFLVVKASSLYNAILGHPTLNSLSAMTSTYHLKMKSLRTRWWMKFKVNKCWHKNLMSVS
ncbi:uncharacterized protein LOC121260261 [Juglans microcarpa x Juglans regia]|uniref:uncharacterized protein LOC121260261 n=1 Tax=Juglans microcarpa x Juglans regia TaxID=2249226 RepID=UPI001B7DA2CA|nr:uncharacterized protein LOC121260261 [Juglans microcarpa x Juglans regia]